MSDQSEFEEVDNAGARQYDRERQVRGKIRPPEGYFPAPPKLITLGTNVWHQVHAPVPQLLVPVRNIDNRFQVAVHPGPSAAGIPGTDSVPSYPPLAGGVAYLWAPGNWWVFVQAVTSLQMKFEVIDCFDPTMALSFAISDRGCFGQTFVGFPIVAGAAAVTIFSPEAYTQAVIVSNLGANPATVGYAQVNANRGIYLPSLGTYEFKGPTLALEGIVAFSTLGTSLSVTNVTRRR